MQRRGQNVEDFKLRLGSKIICFNAFQTSCFSLYSNVERRTLLCEAAGVQPGFL